ncbi:MAG: hypothetical protein H6Q89_1665 [Myxococcaceae bacterium]|nr:hypothetical protein [Myxococcaceae bacterium]
MTSILESYDAVAFTSVLDERLTAATARLAKARGLAEEKVWLEAAVARLAETRAPYLELLQKAARLPELEVVRSAQILELQNVAIDAVERLQAGITFHTGSRMPLLDSLFGKLKFATLRRAESAEFEKFCVDFEKRLNTQYAKRLLVTPAFEFAVPVIEQVRAAFTGWRASITPEPLPEGEAAALIEALRAAAGLIEQPLRQVRLLAEAALTPLSGAFEESGLGAKPKKRAVKAAPKVEEELVAEPAPVEPPPVKKVKVKKARPPKPASVGA